jgi:predicted DNA-binding antitoxin AbrB/MazE fold protein
MADGASHADDHGDDHDETPGYKPPAEKKLEEILNTDQEDESLRKYKAALLGQAAGGVAAIPFPDDPRRVIVTKLAVLVDGHNDLELDLTVKPEELKKHPFVLKEGCEYRVKIYFYVQREIVTGLKYVQKTYRKGLQVDKDQSMVGSYGPKDELQSYTTKPEQAPAGMIARGTYTIKSLFTDDDKNEHLKWEWTLEIKKDWKD